MMRLWTLALLVSLAHSSSDSDNDDSCGLYLAPSTIPNAGLGVFTTRPLQEGQVVDTPSDLCIPIVDQKWHMGRKDFFWTPSEYVWNGDVMNMHHESEVRNGVKGFCPGALDCATNCNLALINVGKSTPHWDTAGLHRQTDEGAGAISPYRGGTTPVIADIPAGGELFKHYGDHWYVGWNEYELCEDATSSSRSNSASFFYFAGLKREWRRLG